jgi:hypothetical protein
VPVYFFAVTGLKTKPHIFDSATGLRVNNSYYETSAKGRLVAELFVVLKIKSSKYLYYSCGLIFRTPRFRQKYSFCRGLITYENFRIIWQDR